MASREYDFRSYPADGGEFNSLASEALTDLGANGWVVKNMQLFNGRVYFLLERRKESYAFIKPCDVCGNCRWFISGSCGEEGWSWCSHYGGMLTAFRNMEGVDGKIRVSEEFPSCLNFKSAKELPDDGQNCSSCVYYNDGVCAYANTPTRKQYGPCGAYKPREGNSNA